MRKDLKDKTGRNLDEILKNASSCVRGNEVDNRFQARCEVLETISEMSNMNLYNRLKLINKAYQGVELEAMLNIQHNYYRERYFALLELVARGIKTDK